MICGSCDAENRAGRKFCAECGSVLAVGCPTCGASNEPGEKFCGECGSALVEGASPARSVVASEGEPAAPVTPVAERRLVSVLFADLVGFTTLSEARDSEEVRELLSKYFDTCRTIITRYGGTVEKFIGDAVMAVWGAPIATEDDAERAVRAALELTNAVAAIGEEAKAPELRARAGVLTGEAAVNIGAVGEGMVAGDMVNTASRIQSAAEPGAVFVGESTKRSTDATIVFEPAGEHELKGKVGLTPLWRAVRVVAGARGTLKSTGLEPPFVGRDRELRVIKELFHASADEAKAHLVSVTGIAGIGKSRLSWEYYKYFDGLQLVNLYHRGRCISYGEGVAYWALAEMVKMRCRIAEEEAPDSAQGKLRSTLEGFVPDAEERAWIEPRLAHLLGLEERAAADKEDLFAAWRLFFERMAEQYPVVMIFEDLQWADAALLDFIEYLLEWSRNHRIFVLTLGRPELSERRPNWGAGKRNFTSLYLEPLSEGSMRELLTGVVPGLPEEI
ncbi:MAG: AAA family ATPase, partial [Actinomycetota bacterium]|nr:AAA family ATPase [Actinomycetota bacterium]